MPNDHKILSPTLLAQESASILLKLTDVLSKMRSIKHLTPYQQKQVATQTKYIYAPIAHRLGLDNIKAELEDLYLEFYAASFYHGINQLLGSTYAERRQFIDEFKKPIEEILQEAGFDFITKSRVKSISSIIDKIHRLNTNLEGIYDVFAIRIILNASMEEEQAKCWQVHDILTRRYQTLPKRFRNWLTEPKASGYQALHITVMDQKLPWVEIQIRSKRMDEVAEKGSAAHWKYKEGDNNSPVDSLNPLLAQIRGFLEEHPHLISEALSAIGGPREL